MMPDYIKELKLGYAFKRHQPPFEDCVLSSNTSELIVDTDFGISEFSSHKDDNGFEIVNKNWKQFSLIQIDGKLIKGITGGQCDCCVVDGHLLLFIELKTKAYSLEHAHERYEKAVKQIGHTIEIFENKCHVVGVEIKEKRNMEGYVCFSNLFPRTNATEQNESVKFLEQNLIPLYFDCKREI